jgi:hypothetical protein
MILIQGSNLRDISMILRFNCDSILKMGQRIIYLYCKELSRLLIVQGGKHLLTWKI